MAQLQESDDQKVQNNDNDKKIDDTVSDSKPSNDESKNNPSYLILMGDSGLDNFYWLMDKVNTNVTSVLRKKYEKQKVQIINLAVDECQSRNVLYGIKPSQVYINERKKLNMPPYPIDESDGIMCPMNILEQMISAKQINFNVPNNYLKPTVVLSVGMSDLKALMPIQDQTQVFVSMLAFEKNVTDILQDLINKLHLNVILCTIFEPFSDFYALYETPRDAYVSVLNLWVPKLFDIADKYGLPVIDLSRTLNTYERSHYAQSIFELSHQTTRFFVDLIDNVLHTFPFKDGNKAQSIIYYGSRAYHGIEIEKNNIGARMSYMKQVQDRIAFKKKEKVVMQEEKKSCDDDDGKLQKSATTLDYKNGKLQQDCQTHIILMGDSVLDNFYWLRDKRKDVRQQILDSYKMDKIDVKCTNLAVDESTSYDVVNGCEPGWTYSDSRKEFGLDPYPIDKNDDDSVRPLKIAKTMVNKNENQIVVLSVGGNDIRAVLWEVTIPKVIKALDVLGKNIKIIAERIVTDFKMNLIVVFCYEPYKTFAPSFGMQREQLLQILNRGAMKLFGICGTMKLPVIDLSRTFNPFDRTHYGTTDIEPSNKSGQFIVDLVRHIHANFDFCDDKSKIYYGIGNEIVEEVNNDETRKKFMQSLLARHNKK